MCNIIERNNHELAGSNWEYSCDPAWWTAHERFVLRGFTVPLEVLMAASGFIA